MEVISAVCPEEIRTRNRKDLLEWIWSLPEWTAAVDTYLLTHPVCDCCGKPAKTVHHTDPEDYPNGPWDTNGIARYMDFTRSKVIPICNRCHNAIRKNQRPCPRCKKHYIPVTGYLCRYCISPEDRTRLRVERQERKRKKKAIREEVNRINRERARDAYRRKREAR